MRSGIARIGFGRRRVRILLVYTQWVATLQASYRWAGVCPCIARSGDLRPGCGTTQDVFSLFLLGITVLTLWTKRPLVEALPAAGISSSALLLVAFPLSFAVRLHGWEREGPWLLLFALVITWAGDTVAYFVGRAIGKHPFAPHLSPKKTWEGAVASFAGSLLVGVCVFVVAKRSSAASAGDGGCREHRGTGRRSAGIGLQAQRGSERLGCIVAGAWRDLGPYRRVDFGDPGSLVLLDFSLLAWKLAGSIF